MSGMMPSSALMRGGMKSCWRYPHSSRHESCAPHPTQLAACSQSAFRPRTARADVRTAQTFALQFIWCVRCRSDFNSLGRRQRILNIDAEVQDRIFNLRVGESRSSPTLRSGCRQIASEADGQLRPYTLGFLRFPGTSADASEGEMVDRAGFEPAESEERQVGQEW